MKHFTIYSNNNITLHPSKKAAKQAGGALFSTEEQFADVIGNDNKRLVEIWNSLPGVEPVKRFQSRKIATERIWRAIQGLGQPTAAQPVPDFGSCVAALEEVPVPETPFDEPKPDPAVTEHPAAIDSAAAQMADQPGEPLATPHAQEPAVAPPATKTNKKATRQKKAPKAPEAKEAKPKEARADM